MADLNEVTRFENELKKLIEERNSLKPHYHEPFYDELAKTSNTLMCAMEHGRPYDNISATRMCIAEHGRPYKSPQVKNNSVTYMVVKEHGKPYAYK